MAARFARACDLLGVHPGAQPLMVACSGGADSAAALLLTRAIAPKARLLACYVDHGIRSRDSIARDVAAVRAQARDSGARVIVCDVAEALRSARGTGTMRSPEERARHARYRALADTAEQEGVAFVLSGHQRDDLVETALLALARGSGIDGVAAMRPMRALSPRVMLARPLLWATKAQCLAYVLSRKVPFSHDETNDDLRIPRNAVRALLSQLEVTVPQASRSIARSLALLADDRELLDGMGAAALSRARVDGTRDLWTAPLRKLPIALLRRVVRAAVALVGGSTRDFSFTHCDAIARAIKQKRGGRYHAGRSAVVLSSGKLLVESSSERRVAPSAPVAVAVARLPATVTTPWGKATFRAATRGETRRPRAVESQAFAVTLKLDLGCLREAEEVVVRAPRPGDTCVPSGRHHPVSLSRFLAKAGVPLGRRPQAAVLCVGGRIAAVLGLRVMAQFQPGPRSQVLTVRWQAADIQGRQRP